MLLRKRQYAIYANKTCAYAHLRALLFLFAMLLAATGFAGTVPQRNAGISMHLLPKRVADLGAGRWGFVVSNASYLKTGEGGTVLQTPAEFLLFVQRQDTQVQENGVWIVTTDPDAYSPIEKTLLGQVISICRKNKIPLFLCRAIDLPGGWKRVDLAR